MPHPIRADDEEAQPGVQWPVRDTRHVAHLVRVRIRVRIRVRVGVRVRLRVRVSPGPNPNPNQRSGISRGALATAGSRERSA